MPEPRTGEFQCPRIWNSTWICSLQLAHKDSNNVLNLSLQLDGPEHVEYGFHSGMQHNLGWADSQTHLHHTCSKHCINLLTGTAICNMH